MKKWTFHKIRKEVNKSNPMKLLTINLDEHNYSDCHNDNCAECNLMADEIITRFHQSNNKKGRIRLTKFQVERMKLFFGDKITKKAISRFSSNETYKRRHYNIIPCSCDAKSHNQCTGMYMIPKNTHRYGSISYGCKCKRHSRRELKEFRTKWENVEWS